MGQLCVKDYYDHFPKFNHFSIFQNDNTSWTSFSTHWNDNFERNWDIHDGPSDSKILSGSSQKVFQIKKATFYRSRQIYTCNIFEWPMTAMLTHDWWVIKNDPWLWRTLFIAKLDIQVEQGIIRGLFGTLNSALWVIPIAI